MKTNQKCRSLRLLGLIIILMFGLISFGQSNVSSYLDLDHRLNFALSTFSGLKNNYRGLNESNLSRKNITKDAFKDGENGIIIKGFKVNGVTRNSAKINVTDQRTNRATEIDVKIGDEFPYGTFFEIPDNIEIQAQTKKGYDLNCEKGVSFYSDSDINHESTRIIKGSCWVSRETIKNNKSNGEKIVAKKKESWWKRSLDWFSGGDTGDTAGLDGTKIKIESDSNQLKILLIEGEVTVSSLNKIIINEKIATDSLEQRELFITKTSNLNSKNKTFENNVDSLPQRKFLDDEAVLKFFKKESIKQKRILKRGGPKSKEGFRLLGRDLAPINSNSDSLSMGIIKYQEAMKDGEIGRDRFIQAALILTEANYRKGDLKNGMDWLDAALYFIKIEQDYNEKRFDKYEDSEEFDLARGFGKDLVVSTEYHTWAYTVKLMLTGCLENAEHNPKKWRDSANNLKCKLKSKNLTCNLNNN